MTGGTDFKKERIDPEIKSAQIRISGGQRSSMPATGASTALFPWKWQGLGAG